MTVTVTVHNTGPRMFQRLRAKYPQAEVRALNRALVSAEAVMSRSIAADTGLPVGAVKKAVKSRRATLHERAAQLRASLRRIPLIDFRARGPEPSRGKGAGVSYALGAQGRSRVPWAFIATMKSGHRGVFMRSGQSRVTSRTRTVARRPRLPIRELFGPSLGRVFIKYVPLGQKAAEESLAKNLAHELRFAISQDKG